MLDNEICSPTNKRTPWAKSGDVHIAYQVFGSGRYVGFELSAALQRHISPGVKKKSSG
jgi:hypothetical protein